MNRSLQRAGRAGMTLIEVLMGAVIVGLVIVSASWAMSTASAGKHVHEESPINAALLASQVHELALTLSTAASGADPAMEPGDVGALDSLDGAIFSPPINSALQTMANCAAWKQLVSISVYAMSDLATPLSTSYTSQAKSASTLYKLDVRILNGAVDMGTYSWWLNP